MPDHLPAEHLETGRASSAQRQGKLARYFNEKELRVFYRLDTPPILRGRAHRFERGRSLQADREETIEYTISCR
ncbi:MAG: hypothetical protein COS95_01610 [Ignavibacteriales bacterium CG07_land_8_20_14_0_80_59_12]|nr:MAG: hypothetical protein COS95_01610 [Ignavibacteriales bacterium CG07_land_8_20_14_0_80_59_12]